LFLLRSPKLKGPDWPRLIVYKIIFLPQIKFRVLNVFKTTLINPCFFVAVVFVIVITSLVAKGK